MKPHNPELYKKITKSWWVGAKKLKLIVFTNPQQFLWKFTILLSVQAGTSTQDLMILRVCHQLF